MRLCSVCSLLRSSVSNIGFFYFLAFCETQFLFSLFYRLAVFMICTAAEAFPVIIAEPAAKYSALSNRYALKRSIQFTFLFAFTEFIVTD